MSIDPSGLDPQSVYKLLLLLVDHDFIIHFRQRKRWFITMYPSLDDKLHTSRSPETGLNTPRENHHTSATLQEGIPQPPVAGTLHTGRRETGRPGEPSVCSDRERADEGARRGYIPRRAPCLQQGLKALADLY